MAQKQIPQKWDTNGRIVFVHGDCFMAPTSADAYAIAKAFNGTYGQNIDPEYVGKMYEMLHLILRKKGADMNATEREEINNLLTAAKIQ